MYPQMRVEIVAASRHRKLHMIQMTNSHRYSGSSGTFRGKSTVDCRTATVRAPIVIQIVGRTAIGGEFAAILVTFLLEKSPHLGIGRKDQCRCSELRAHVGDDITVHRRE